MHGTITSAAEVTNISRHGFWMLLGDEELLLSYEHSLGLNKPRWRRSPTLNVLLQITSTGRAWTLTYPLALFAGPKIFRSCRAADCATVAETRSPRAGCDGQITFA